MNSTQAYRRRLRALLLDEDFGPKLARLNVAETTRVLQLVEANQGAQARRLITELDARRRGDATYKRRERARAHTVAYIIAELIRVGTDHPVNSSTVALGVAIMTAGQRSASEAMDGEDLRVNAGTATHIQWASDYGKHWNPWWYH